MIPKKFRERDLIGRKCRPDHSIKNGAGVCITTDTICTIRSAYYNVTIVTETCPCCGMKAYISGISRSELTLIDEGEQGGAGVNREAKDDCMLHGDVVQSKTEVTRG